MPRPDPATRSRPGLLMQAAPITSMDAESRQVDAVFSTSALVTHWVRHNGEVRRMPTRLVIDAAAVDLEQLIASGPVLDSHASWGAASVLGRVEDAWIQDGQALARLSFSRAADAEPIWQKVEEGMLRNVSVGFTVQAQDVREEQNESGETINVMYFTKWRPEEISMVAMGADPGARTQGVALDQITQHIDPTPGSDAGSEARPGMPPAVTPSQAAAAADNRPNEETPMPELNQGAAQPVQTPTQNADAIRQQERTRIAEIRQTATDLSLDDAQMVQTAIDDNSTADEFRRAAVAAFAQRGQSATQGIGGPRATVTLDAREKFVQGAELGLMARAGMAGGERNEFTGYTLAELARQSLTLSGSRIPSDRRELVGRAFTQSGGSHTSSDFANVLANVAGKAALIGWEEAEDSFTLWTRPGVLTDFKASKRVGLGLLTALPEVPEGGDYTHGTVGDRGETITLATYGKVLKVTRQAIINDDLSLFSTLPRAMGRSAKRTIGNLVYAILTGNPTMADGVALFASGHSNLAGSAAAPSVASLGAARAAMRTQVEAAGGSPLNISPRYFLVPAALETAATQLINSTVDPTASKGHASNPVAGMAEVIADGRLDQDSATAWYLAGDPMNTDTIEVAYLDGNDEPFIEQMDSWTSDGVDLKVRIDAAAAPLDHRALYKNAGA